MLSVLSTERAVGYNYEAVKIFMPAGAKKPVIVPYIEHVIILSGALHRVSSQTARTQISNSTPISMICELGILKYAPGRWALWCMNANSSSRHRAKPGRRPDGMIVS